MMEKSGGILVEVFALIGSDFFLEMLCLSVAQFKLECLKWKLVTEIAENWNFDLF